MFYAGVFIQAQDVKTSIDKAKIINKQSEKCCMDDNISKKRLCINNVSTKNSLNKMGADNKQCGKMLTNEALMRVAIALSVENVAKGGGPFGAVVARDGIIIATGTNRVTFDCDPTAHAEVSAIRAAAKMLGTFDLSGCQIYTSCEPCPMCLGAIYWARLNRMYYGNNKHDAAKVGFDDAFIYKELELKPDDRKLKSEVLLPDEAIKAFKDWESKMDKVKY